MNARASMLHIRADEDTKGTGDRRTGAMGLSLSEAVRIFLKRVVADQAFPLE